MSEAEPGDDGLSVRPIEDKSDFAAFMIKTWGTQRMMVQMVTYDVTEMEATGLYDAAGQLLAIASWTLRNRTAYLCALHAFTGGEGHAKRLLRALVAQFRGGGARAIRAIVTNDNLPGMAFYQKQGFRFANLYVGAIDAYRGLAPNAITHGHDGIPIHDALELELEL